MMNDLISRQDAINAIDGLPNCYNGYSDSYDKSYIIGVLEELPSAEPEPHWIPFSERLPKKHGRYLVSVYDHNRKYLEVGISYFYPEINDFDFLNAYENYYWEVKAWMERPEPYQEEKKCRKKKQ